MGLQSQSDFPDPPPLPLGWSTKEAMLKPTHVYDSFKIVLLLEYHILINSQLIVPHLRKHAHRNDAPTQEKLLQSHCFDEAMKVMNESIRDSGQPEIDCKCARCVRTLSEGGISKTFL